MSTPMDDVTVIEVDNFMAAPSAAAILADLGARVIKIEPLRGDPMRGIQRPPRVPDEMKDFDFQFDVDNRGKSSIAIALDTEAGQALVHRLVTDAQVFLCNLLPRRQQKFRLDPETLSGLNPAIVHATLTGYGTTGPEAWRPGYDVTAFFGRSGLYDAMREGEDGVVPMARPAQGDHTTGLSMLAAILGALRLAERTGEAQIVETSLYETAIWTQATDYSAMTQERKALRPRPREKMIIPTANRYPCGDGKWIVLNNPEERAWPILCRVLDREAWLEDPRFVDLKSRFQNMEALVAGIDEALSVRGRDEWGVLLDEAGLIWGAVLGLHEVVDDPQAEAIGMFPEMAASIGRYRTVRAPFRFHSADVGPRGPAPALGEHTRQILEGAGLSADEIAGLAADGIVGGVGL